MFSLWLEENMRNFEVEDTVAITFGVLERSA